jgi:hypothetical protein
MEQQPFSDDPLLRPIEDVTRSMQTEPGSDQLPVSLRPEVQARITDIETVMEYARSIEGRALGAFFGSVVQGESDSSLPDPEDGLAGYDTSSPVQSLAFETAISTEYLKPALHEAGLELDNDSLARMYIADGDRFVAFLKDIPTASATMKAGIVEIVRGAFTTIMMAHAPGVVDERYDTYHRQPMLLPEVSAGLELATSYGIQTDQTILHAPEIADAVRVLDVDELLSVELTMLHEAAREGKLGEWSVAYDWGLHKRPTTSMRSAWEQWLFQDEWQKLFEFMDGAQERSAGGSVFMQGLTSRIIANITDLRNGNIVQVEAPAPPSYEDEDDEDLHFSFPDEYAEDADRATYWDSEQDALLAQVVTRLQSYRF